MPSEEYRRGFRDGYKDALRGIVEAGIGQTGRTGRQKFVDARLKAKRKPSAYSKRYGIAYKKLKRKHPRMSFGSLSKKAHKEARR